MRLLSILIQASAIVTVGNACGYLVQLLMARALAPADFGAVNALLALSILMVAPLTVAHQAIAKSLIDDGERPDDFAALVRLMVYYSMALSVALGLAYLPFAGFVQAWFKVDALSAFVMLPILVIATFLYHVPLGIWQGARSHRAFAIGTATVPVGRLLALVGIMALGWGSVVSALGAFIAGAVTLAFGGLLMQRRYLASRSPAPKGWFMRMLRFALPATFMSTGLLALAYIDLPIVRAIAAPELSGQYAAASNLAKLALILPAALVNVVFPEAASLVRDGARPRDALRLIGTALALTALIGGGVAAVMALAPAIVLTVLLGPAYVPAAPLLSLLAPTMALLAMVTTVATYALARGGRELIAPVALAPVLVTVVALWLRPEPLAMAALVLAVVVGLAAACVAWLIMACVGSSSGG